MNGTLQYQLSTGSWRDCGERTEEFILRCEKTSGIPRDKVLDLLISGNKVRNSLTDWYSNCRIKPEPKPEFIANEVFCSCGHSVPGNQVMSSSMGTSCPDCYDIMSV